MASSRQSTIGILYAGEMGAALGRALVASGSRVVTTCEGRSARTAERCAESGIEALPTLRDVTSRATLLVSLVPPRIAPVLAREVARLLPEGEPVVYCDANSISPTTSREIAALFDPARATFVDASIHGLASRLVPDATLYLSGEASGRVADELGAILRVEIVGKQTGAASMHKMLLGGMSKGLVSLFVEVGVVAREADLLDEFLESCTRYYPGVIDAMERLLPTLPRHALRRSQEMSELENTIRSLGLRPGFAHEAQRLLQILGESPLSDEPRNETRALREQIEAIALQHPLRPTNDPINED